jgi:hypothetical protein
MTIPITINLPDEVYHRAERFAKLANRDLTSIITDTVLSALPPIGHHIETLPPIDDLSDTELVAIANSRMQPEQDARMSVLLAKQRENELVVGESDELQALMQSYQEGWLRQTAALTQAIKRGLMEPMES